MRRATLQLLRFAWTDCPWLAAPVNPDEEGKLYGKLVDAGATIISIAHRLELRQFHKRELILKGDGSGSWELRDL